MEDRSKRMSVELASASGHAWSPGIMGLGNANSRIGGNGHNKAEGQEKEKQDETCKNENVNLDIFMQS